MSNKYNTPGVTNLLASRTDLELSGVNIPGDICMLIILYKIQLESRGIYTNTFREISELIKIFSNSGIDRIITYTKQIIENYLRPMRLTPGSPVNWLPEQNGDLAKLISPGCSYFDDKLIPELMKYDCYISGNYGYPRRGRITLEIRDKNIIYVSRGRSILIYFKIISYDPETNGILIKRVNNYTSHDFHGAYVYNKNTHPRDIVELLINWSEKLVKLINMRFDFKKSVKCCEFLLPHITPGAYDDVVMFIYNLNTHTSRHI